MAARYVALGDSYAAGVGAGDSAGPCRRTDAGYPLAVAHGLGEGLSWEACSGATVADVRRVQLAALETATSHVSITVGGNDIGFAPVLVSAAQPAWMSDTALVIEGARRLLREELPGRLDELYADVRARAPRAEVLVTTYPRLFNGEDCSLLTFFDPDEMAELNDTADELARCLADAAARAGFGCADVLPAFVGHAACDDEEWINGVSWPVEESFHPRRPGHDAYARAVASAWGVTPARPAEPLLVRHGPGGGSAPSFAVPDLLSMASLAGASAHGLDPDEIADLARRCDVDPEARPRLHELDRQVRARRRAR